MKLHLIDILKESRRSHYDGRDAGAVAIEFAILMAFLPLPILAFGIVDYGVIMEKKTNLTAVIRGAAEYARGQVVQGKAPPATSDLQTLLGVPAVVSTTCTCADNTPLATCPGAGDANPCAASPPANGDTRVLKYVAVSGAQTYTPIVPGTWPFPPSVSATTVLRTQ
jgi:Flp pilus assembly protein TadG